MSKTGFSLVDLGELSAPVTKLIESVSNAIGVLYEPRRIREKAKAEAEASIIKAEAEIEVNEITERASRRINNVELRRQENIESIVLIAIDQMPDSVSDRPVDEDWIAQFFDFSKDVGNEELQSIWARLLAGEVASPGTYSLRTLHLVKLLSPNDAMLFEKSSNYISNQIFLFDHKRASEYLTSIGLSYKELEHLESVNLFLKRSHFGFSPGSVYRFQYFDRLLNASLREEKGGSILRYYQLSDIGIELLNLCESNPDYDYYEALLNTLIHDCDLDVTEQ